MINFVLLFIRFVNGLPKCPIELFDFTLVLFLAVFQMIEMLLDGHLNLLELLFVLGQSLSKSFVIGSKLVNLAVPGWLG